MNLKSLHHIAVICSNYPRSKQFYTEILGFKIEQEVYRSERQSYKLDLSLNGTYLIELFSFPEPPQRLTRPESAGLRHLAFGVEDIAASIEWLRLHHIEAEPVRTDEFTLKRFTFFEDPDRLPIELYEL